MKILSQQKINSYLESDRATKWLDNLSSPSEEQLVCQQWLRKTPAKRYIYEELYGDLISTSERLRILDVGGGLTAFTKILAKKHEYTLVDILAHDSNVVAEEMMKSVGRSFIFTEDWFTLPKDYYDIILANDIFPNVDQRLDIFLDRFIKEASLIRTALTWYDKPRFY